MGAVQIPDDLERVIQRQVAKGRTPDLEAFVHEAVFRLLEEADAEQDDIGYAAHAGLSDAGVGRATTIATPADEQAMYDRPMTRLRNHLLARK